MNACIAVGRLTEAERCLARMQDGDVAPGVRAYNTLIKHHARKGDPEGAKLVIKAMRVHGLQPDLVSYNSLMQVRG